MKEGINEAQLISYLTCIVIPLAAIREYWLFRNAKDKEGKKQSPMEYLDSQYQDSIFQYLEEGSPSYDIQNGRQEQQQETLNKSLLEYRRYEDDDEDADSNGSQEIKLQNKMWFSPKKLFWMSVFWNIFSIPLNSVSSTIFGLQNSTQQNYFQDRVVQSIACSITSLFLQLFLNISLFFYGFVIQGQGVFLLLSEQQQNNSNESHIHSELQGNDDNLVNNRNPNRQSNHVQRIENNEKIKKFLKSCMQRALVVSICFEMMLLFTWIRNMIYENYNPELLSKNSLFLICRQVMTLFLTITTKSKFLNPNMLRQQKIQSTYTNAFQKYYEPQKLWNDYIQIFGDDINNRNNDDLFMEFIKQRSEQVKNYVKRVEVILQDPKNNLSRFITNNQQIIQFQLKAVFIWLLGFSQLILLVISCYFYITTAQPSYFWTFGQNNNPIVTITDFVENYYSQNKKTMPYLITTDSTSIIIFNIIIVIQSVSMIFVRSAFAKANLLNHNARSYYV